MEEKSMFVNVSMRLENWKLAQRKRRAIQSNAIGGDTELARCLYAVKSSGWRWKDSGKPRDLANERGQIQ